MSLRFRTGTLLALWLATLLLVGQILFLQHQTDLAQHTGYDHCEWCLTHVPLAGTLPGGGLSLPASTAQASPVALEFPPQFHAVSAPYAPRAPPAAF